MVEGTPSCCEGRDERGGWREIGKRGERRKGKGRGKAKRRERIKG